MQGIYCLDVRDYEGRRCVFTYRQLELKSPRRPELREKEILGRIKETLVKPNFVYADLEHSNRLIYYREEYKIDDRMRYMKIVLEIRDENLFVVTAFRPDYVKERGKTKLLYGTDN